MKKTRIPKIGLRNIKTGLAVFLCLMTYAATQFVLMQLQRAEVNIPEFFATLLGENTVVYACLAAVVVMGSSVSKSFRSGVSRIIGTVIGGVFASLYLHLGGYLKADVISFLLIPVGLIILIYILTLIKEKDSVVIAAATYLIIVITLDTGAPLLYSLSRVLSTSYGVVVSLCVNNFIGRPKNEEKTENEQKK